MQQNNTMTKAQLEARLNKLEKLTTGLATGFAIRTAIDLAKLAPAAFEASVKLATSAHASAVAGLEAIKAYATAGYATAAANAQAAYATATANAQAAYATAATSAANVAANAAYAKDATAQAASNAVNTVTTTVSETATLAANNVSNAASYVTTPVANGYNNVANQVGNIKAAAYNTLFTKPEVVVEVVKPEPTVFETVSVKASDLFNYAKSFVVAPEVIPEPVVVKPLTLSEQFFAQVNGAAEVVSANAAYARDSVYGAASNVADSASSAVNSASDMVTDALKSAQDSQAYNVAATAAPYVAAGVAVIAVAAAGYQLYNYMQESKNAESLKDLADKNAPAADKVEEATEERPAAGAALRA